jgi:hypothetical protein
MQTARHRPSRAAAVAVGVLATAAFLGACDQGASAGTAEPSVEPAPGISIPGDLSIDGSRSASPSGADSAPADDAAVACAELQEAWAATNRALVDLSPEHPRALVSSFRAAHRAVTSVEEPPADIEPAWSTMSEYLGGVVAAFEDVDVDDAEAVSAAMSGAISAGDTERATSAAEDVTAYTSASCANR